MEYIYLDNASTTPLDKRVLEKMTPYLTEIYGNASSLHFAGRQAVKGLDEARELTASLIGAKFNEVYFTSGATEVDNLALRGLYNGDKNKLVISSIEHSAVLKTASELEKQGVKTILISPNKDGFVNANDFYANADGAYLCSLMLCNNEIGTIQPVKEMADKVHQKGCLVYTDAVQAMPSINVNVNELGVDMLGFSAHKFNGPKGVGCAYIKSGTLISPTITGGHQERGFRGGTSNVAGAIGLAYALKYTRETLQKDGEYVKKLRDYFIDKVLFEIKNTALNGSRENRLFNNANVLFKNVDGNALLANLDMNGVCASLGAACSAGSIEPSHVLTEIGLTESEAFSSIRFTFSKNNTVKEVDKVVEILKNAIFNLTK